MHSAPVCSNIQHQIHQIPSNSAPDTPNTKQKQTIYQISCSHNWYCSNISRSFYFLSNIKTHTKIIFLAQRLFSFKWTRSFFFSGINFENFCVKSGQLQNFFTQIWLFLVQNRPFLVQNPCVYAGVQAFLAGIQSTSAYEWKCRYQSKSFAPLAAAQLKKS